MLRFRKVTGSSPTWNFNLAFLFLQIILDCYNEYEIPNASRPITFRKLIYHKRLLSELLNVFNDKKNKTREADIIETLQYFNFNHARFVTFNTDRITLELNEQPTAAETIHKLYWYSKSYNQMQTKPQFALYPHLPSLKELCCSWIQEEIFFHEKKVQPALLLQNVNASEIKPIATSLSVYQLGFLVRILVENGIFKNQSCRKMINAAAVNFKTDDADKISSESLRIKAYSPDPATIRKVKDLLLNLLAYINKNFKVHVLLSLLTHVFQEGILVLSDSGLGILAV
jgi:hypothetical protein